MAIITPVAATGRGCREVGTATAKAACRHLQLTDFGTVQMNARAPKLQGLAVLPLHQDLRQVAQVMDLALVVHQRQDQHARLWYPAFTSPASTCDSTMTCWSPLC